MFAAVRWLRSVTARARGRRPPDIDLVLERLAEDEAPRGGLEDDAYGPLLAAVSALAAARSARFASTDELSAAARALLRATARAAASGRASGLADALAPFGVGPPIGLAPDAAAANARAIATALGATAGSPGEAR